jgi:hypothetical protein
MMFLPKLNQFLTGIRAASAGKALPHPAPRRSYGRFALAALSVAAIASVHNSALAQDMCPGSSVSYSNTNVLSQLLDFLPGQRTVAYESTMWFPKSGLNACIANHNIAINNITAEAASGTGLGTALSFITGAGIQAGGYYLAGQAANPGATLLAAIAVATGISLTNGIYNASKQEMISYLKNEKDLLTSGASACAANSGVYLVTTNSSALGSTYSPGFNFTAWGCYNIIGVPLTRNSINAAGLSGMHIARGRGPSNLSYMLGQYDLSYDQALDNRVSGLTGMTNQITGAPAMANATLRVSHSGGSSGKLPVFTNASTEASWFASAAVVNGFHLRARTPVNYINQGLPNQRIVRAVTGGTSQIEITDATQSFASLRVPKAAAPGGYCIYHISLRFSTPHGPYAAIGNATYGGGVGPAIEVCNNGAFYGGYRNEGAAYRMTKTLSLP